MKSLLHIFLKPSLWYFFEMELIVSTNTTDSAYSYFLCASFGIQKPHLLTYWKPQNHNTNKDSERQLTYT